MKKLHVLPSALAVLMLLGGAARAAPVFWTVQPTTITSVNDVDLTGVLVHAGTWGGASVDVTVGAETITFADRPINSTDGFAGAPGNGETLQAGIFAEPAGFDASFSTVLDSFVYDGANPKVVTLEGLTIGTPYQVQFFVSDDRDCCGGRTQRFSDSPTDGAGNETAVFSHNESIYTIGEFTADDTSQLIYARGVGQGQNIVNGYVLRMLDLFEATYTWNGGAVGDWKDADWTKDPLGYPPAFPVDNGTSQRVKAVIDTGGANVTVTEDRTATDLDVISGQVTIGSNNSLTITSRVNASTIVMQGGATFSAGSGSIDDLSIAGTSIVAPGLALSIGNLSDGGTAATLVKAGDGTATVDSVDLMLGSILQIDGGTLAVGGASPIGNARAVRLNGGTFQITADSGIPTSQPLVTDGLTARFDAAEITGVADGGDVNAWPDSAGFYDATTMSATAPQWIQSVPELNGNPVVRFDDTGNEWLDFEDIDDIRTVFWILKDSAPGNIQFLLGDDVTYHFHGDIPGYIWSGWTSGNVLNGTTELNGDAIDGRTTLHPLDYSVLSVVTTGPVEASRISWDRDCCNGRGWRGDFADILIYNRPLTDPEVDQITAHLQNRYGLGTPLPITMTDTDFTVTDVSTLEVLGTGEAQFGKLTLGAAGIVTTTGTVGSVTFTGGTEILVGATTVGVATEVETVLGTISGAATTGPFTFTKAGPLPLTIEPGGANEMTAMSNATIDAAGGTLTMAGLASWAGSTKAQLSGGTLQIVGNENPSIPATLPNLGDKLLLHLDAADLAAAGLLDGDPVASWQGKGEGATFTQGDFFRQPTFETNVLNGLPAVHFWGAEGDDLNGDRMHSNPSGIDGVTNIFSVTSVEPGAPGLTTMFARANDRALIRVNSQGANPGDTGLYRGSGNAVNFADFTFTTSDFKVNGVTTDAFKMSEHHIVDARGTPEGFDNMVLGDNGQHNRYWKGDIPEFLMYKDLTPLQRNQIGWYLQEKYDLAAQYTPIDPLAMTSHDFAVTADSTLEATTWFDAEFGGLTLHGGMLTTEGSATSISFTSTTIAGTSVGITPAVPTDLGPLDGGGLGATIAVGGDLALDDPATGMTGSTFDVQAGTLTGYRDAAVNPFGDATLKANGGKLLLSAKPGVATGSVDYDNPIEAVGGVIGAGPGDAGHAGPMVVNLAATHGVDLSGNVELASEAGFELNVAGKVTGLGGATINNGTVTFSADDSVFGRLTVTGGTATIAGTGTTVDTLTVTGGVVAASNDLGVTTKVILADASYGITGGSMAVQGSDLLGGATLTVNGGTLAISSSSGTMPDPLVFWVDANDPTTFTFVTDNEVATWTDKSLTGKVLTSAGTSAVLRQGGAINGHATVAFDGTNYMTFDSDLTLPAQAGESSSAFVVAKTTDELGDDTLMSRAGANVQFLRQQDARVHFYKGTGDVLIDGDTVTEDRVRYAEFNYDADPVSDRVRYAVNGVFSPPGANSHDLGDNDWILNRLGGGGGCCANWIGDIAEILLFDRVLTVDEQNAVGGYLAAKYDVATSYTGSLGGDVAQATTSLLITGDATLVPSGGTVVLGDLTVTDDVTTLTMEEAVFVFNNVAVGDGVTIVGEITVRASLDVGNRVGTMTIDEGELVFDNTDATAVYHAEVSLGGSAPSITADKIVVTGSAAIHLDGTLAPQGIGRTQSNFFSAGTTLAVVDNSVGGVLTGVAGDTPFEFATVDPAPAADKSAHIGQGAFLRDVVYDRTGGFVTRSVDLDVFVALGGDTDGDKKVWLSDWAALRAHFGNTATDKTWTEGNFDPWVDGKVWLSDWAALRANFGNSDYTAAGTAAVPEPGTIVMLLTGLAGLVLLGRRTRRHSR